MTSSSAKITLIQQHLVQALAPTKLNIIDESYKHQGHIGASTGLGHFAIEIAAPIFNSKSLMTCHRLIYQALGELMQTDVHALRIKIIKTDENK